MDEREHWQAKMWVPGDLFLAQNRQGEHRAASSDWRKVRRYKQSKRVTGAGDQRARQRAAMTGEKMVEARKLTWTHATRAGVQDARHQATCRDLPCWGSRARMGWLGREGDAERFLRTRREQM